MYFVQNNPNALSKTLQNKKKCTNGQTEFVFNKNRSHKTHGYVSSISPLLIEYDFITELIKSKTAKYDKCDKNAHFSFIKDSLTLISTKLNAIKEEETTLNSCDAKVQCEEYFPFNSEVRSRDNIMDNYKPEITSDNNSSGFCSGPPSPRKLISESSLRIVSVHSGLQLSCSVSNSTVSSSALNMEKEKEKNLEKIMDHLKLLEELLNVTDASLPLHHCSTLEFDEPGLVHNQALMVNYNKWASGSEKNYNIEPKTRSQQTENKGGTNLVKNLKKNDNLTGNKQINKNKIKIPDEKLNTKLVRKQKITNSGDFSEINKRAYKNKTMLDNQFSYTSKRKVNVLNRSTLNNKSFNSVTSNGKNVRTTSSHLRRISGKIVNETEKHKLPACSSRNHHNDIRNSNESVFDNVSLELRKNNYSKFCANQNIQNLAEKFKTVIKDLDIKNLNRIKNFERKLQNKLKIDESVLRSRSNITEKVELQLKQSKTDINQKKSSEDPTKSIMKIVLNSKARESHQNSDSDLSNYRLSSVSEENESDNGTFKSDSKVFNVDSSVFFSNAYRAYKQQKGLVKTDNNSDGNHIVNVEKIQRDLPTRRNTIHNTTLSSCKDIKLKRSDIKVESQACIFNVGTDCGGINVTEVLSKSFKDYEIEDPSIKTKTFAISPIYLKDNEIVDEKHEKPMTRVKSCVLIHDQRNPIKNTKIYSNIIDFCNQIENNKNKSDCKNGKSNSYSDIHNVSKISDDSNHGKCIKDAQVNTIITMKKNRTISQQKIFENYNQDEIVKRNDLNSSLHDTLKIIRGSNVEVKTLSDGSSMTFYQPSHLYNLNGEKSPVKYDSTSSADKVKNYKGSNIKQLNSRKFSSEQVIRKISKTSNLSMQQKDGNLQRQLSEINNWQSSPSCSRAEKCCTSLFINKSKIGGSTAVSPLALSEADSIGTFLSNHQYKMKMKKMESCEMAHVCKKYSSFNTTEDVIAKINKLSFMGYECNWQRQSNELWQFTLLDSRLSLIFRLDPKEDALTKTEFERRISSIGLQKYVKHRRRNSLNAIAVKFVSETIRHYITTRRLDRIGVVPNLLARCVDIVKQGTKWEKEMHVAKIKLLYELDNNDVLTIQINHQTLDATWHITMRLELQKEAGKMSWPEAKDVRIVEITTDQALARCEITTHLKSIKQDWNHIPNTIWTIYDYLMHTSIDNPETVASNSVLSRSLQRGQNANSQMTVLYSGGGRQPSSIPRSSCSCSYRPSRRSFFS